MICRKCGGEVHQAGVSFIPMGEQCHCQFPEIIK
jgi:hypothetical protein